MLNKSCMLFLFLALSSCSSTPPVPSSTPFTSTWVRVHKNPDPNQDGKITVRVISDGQRFIIDERMESIVDGENLFSRIIWILNGQNVNNISFPTLGSKDKLEDYELDWIKIKNTSSHDTVIEKDQRKRLKFWAATVSKKISSGEIIAGRKTSLWSGKSMRLNGMVEETIKAWIDDETGISLKVMVHEKYQGDAGQGSGEYTIECTNINYGALQSADLIGFVLPDEEYIRALKVEWMGEDREMKLKHQGL